jgi:hypothetical protein
LIYGTTCYNNVLYRGQRDWERGEEEMSNKLALYSQASCRFSVLKSSRITCYIYIDVWACSHGKLTQVLFS